MVALLLETVKESPLGRRTRRWRDAGDLQHRRRGRGDVVSVHFAPSHVSIIARDLELGLGGLRVAVRRAPTATQCVAVVQDTPSRVTPSRPFGVGTADVGFSEVPL